MLFVHLIYVLANYGAAPVALPLFPAFANKKKERRGVGGGRILRWMMMDNNIGGGGEMKKENARINVGNRCPLVCMKTAS